ncbi:MAG TPA: nucleotidyltransferase family protein [Polyangiales bacterium]|jgi:CTP:molybdopterin cytidylyltransferase MocA|nr:nucleotidyltransferase family protein [Polyangiales bacterium]
MAATGSAILAAGGSRRLGQPKQLVSMRGEPLVRGVATLAAAVSGENVAVVLGCEAERVRAALHGLPCAELENAAWQEGIASSIRVAVRWAEARELAALMLLVCDQTHLSQAVLLQLWAAWEARPQLAAAACYAGTTGVPAVFPREYYAALLSLQGDRGAAKLLQGSAVSRVAWPDGVHDVDTPTDLEGIS